MSEGQMEVSLELLQLGPNLPVLDGGEPGAPEQPHQGGSVAAQGRRRVVAEERTHNLPAAKASHRSTVNTSFTRIILVCLHQSNQLLLVPWFQSEVELNLKKGLQSLLLNPFNTITG